MNKIFPYLVVSIFIFGCERESINNSGLGTNTDTVIHTNTRLSGYLSGDFHQHTTYTDGSWSFGYVMSKNNAYGLNWWVNSEHGGSFSRNGALSGLDLGLLPTYWGNSSDIILKGIPNDNAMWRWQCIKEFSFNEVLKARKLYFGRMILQGFEWNVPGHEHADITIITGQYASQANASALSEFEYTFDNHDYDNIGDTTAVWVKNYNAGHQKTLDGIRWMQTNYAGKGWIIPGHPERKSVYSIADFRDMNNAGPVVCFGFEGMPGHQKGLTRGMYSSAANTYSNCTYGGAGYMTAKIGGVWDALLSEGRHWWVFANSDFHDVYNDFYPGEYQKNYVFIKDKENPQSLLDGMKSGNSYFVTGDLIDSLYFYADSTVMGGDCQITSDSVTIHIRVHDPEGSNQNNYSSYNKPVLNHIDLISGEVTGLTSSGTADYSRDFVLTTKVIARFDANGSVIDSKGLASSKWINTGKGWKEMKYTITGITGDIYVRLRGTNHDLNVPEETDEDSNPLPDNLKTLNSAQKAFADLWFYSNPIFVKSKK